MKIVIDGMVMPKCCADCPYDYFHKTAIVNKTIRDEILRRMKEK